MFALQSVRSSSSRPFVPRTLAIIIAALAVAALFPTNTVVRTASAAEVGAGKYALTASVFGTDLDGLIGQTTSNGRKVRPFDRMVALPACTESSCPWLPISAEAGDEFGAQTLCAESDGLCWVQIVSAETGKCAVAPVIDRGPLFVRDNWWFPRAEREYDLKRGVPAAEAARDGADFGFGEGMSDAGYDVAGEFTYAAGMDIAAGTWVDLGLDPDAGIGEFTVTLLWQAGVNHAAACGGDYGNARTVDSVNFRAGPSTSDQILTELPTNERLTIVGASQNGFYQVDVDGMRGWVFSEYAKPDGAKANARVGFITDEVNFRAASNTSSEIVQVVPEGSIVVITGNEQNNFLPVKFDGTTGWISSDYIDTGSSGGGGGAGETATTTDDLNFRAGPSLDAEIISVAPPGTEVALTGDEQNGFMSVTYGGFDGWMSSAFLMTGDGPGEGETLTVAEDLNLRDDPSLSAAIQTVMPAGATVTVTGDAEDGFLPVTYKGKAGWAFAQFLT
jgi:uncharacterized protein YgiM (DUF1202 family)